MHFVMVLPNFTMVLPSGDDDTTAINEALAVAPRGGGVWCPPAANGYRIAGQLMVPHGRVLIGGNVGLVSSRFTETISLNPQSRPESTCFEITSTDRSPIVLRHNSVVHGITFYYPDQKWGIRSLAQSFTTYPATIQLGDDSETHVSNANVRSCVFLGATTCIKQHASNGTPVATVNIEDCTGVLLGEFLRLNRATDVSYVRNCLFSPRYATNFVHEMGGDVAAFRTRAAQVGRVFHLGGVDGLEVSNVFAFGAHLFAHYDTDMFTGDANAGVAGSFTNCSADGTWQAFRISRSQSVFPLNLANCWFAPFFRPNGRPDDAATQAFVYLALPGLSQLRIHVANVRVHGAAVGEFAGGYSGPADHCFNAAAAPESTTNVLVQNAHFDNVNLAVVAPAMAGRVHLGWHGVADEVQPIAFPRRISRPVVALPYRNPVATDAALGDFFRLTVTHANDFTISNPTNPAEGQEITYDIHNDTGGVMGRVTWGNEFKFSVAWVNPSNGRHRLKTFIRLGGRWREKNASADQAD